MKSLMNLVALIIAFLFLNGGVLMAQHEFVTGQVGIPWENVKAAIAEIICVSQYISEGEEYLTMNMGRKICKQPEASTPVDKAVDAAYEKAFTLVSSLPPERWDLMASQQERNRMVCTFVLPSMESMK
jgi:hypothetical protein